MIRSIFAYMVLTAFGVATAGAQLPTRSYYSLSSTHYDTDSAEVNFEFLTRTGQPFLDDFIIYAVSDDDSVFIKTDFSGRISFKLVPGNYAMRLSSDLMENDVIWEADFQRYRAYHYTFHLATRTIPLEIRYDLGKPVIYCYNTDTAQEISIQLKCAGDVQFLYPESVNGWYFTTDTAGIISCNGHEYPYLFWDAKYTRINDYFAKGNGFTIDRFNLVDFFDSVLVAMNFNDRERTDFIVYWVPKMIVFETVDIHFLFNGQCDELASLMVQPKPAELFRVYMIWRPADGRRNLLPQSVPVIDRGSFTLVEWGGMMVKKDTAVK